MTTTDRRRMLVIGVIVPIAIALAGVVAILVSLPQLPDRIAVHWGPNGQPDGFGSPIVGVVVILVVVAAYSAFALSVTRSGVEHGVTANQRMILAIGPFLAVLITVLIADTTLMQRGLADGADAGSIFPYLIGAFAGAIVAAVVAWFLLPESVEAPPIDKSTAPALKLGVNERAVWMHRLAPSRWLGILVAAVGGLALLGGAVALWIAAPIAVFATYVLVMGSLAVLVASTMFWRVRIDERGFSAVSAVGVPRYVYPLSDIEAAASVVVDPPRDFGGWGIRWGGRGRTGVVTRRGEAIEVQRTNGRVLVVTVDDAARGAALLNALVTRHATLR